jgi:hypothetical protein
VGPGNKKHPVGIDHGAEPRNRVRDRVIICCDNQMHGATSSRHTCELRVPQTDRASSAIDQQIEGAIKYRALPKFFC